MCSAMFKYVTYSWSGGSEVITTLKRKKLFNCWKTDYVRKNLKANTVSEGKKAIYNNWSKPTNGLNHGNITEKAAYSG